MTQGTPDFYMNYAPVPPRLRRFLWLATPVLLSGLAVLTAGTALLMDRPGAGHWSASEVALEGVVLDSPWPVLRVFEGGRWRSVLLVEYGKLGADRAVRQAGVAGRRARVHGTVIERNGRRMLELAPRPGAIEDLGASDVNTGFIPAPSEMPGGVIDLEGEIVDPKCYLGAMQPGQGVVHRGCARVCIAGGIPAGFIFPGASGDDRFCLLLWQRGEPLGEACLQWVGTPVRVRGTLEQWDDLEVLRVESIHGR